MQAVAPLEKVMKRFVMRQNIEHYRALLDVTTDPSQKCCALVDRSAADGTAVSAYLFYVLLLFFAPGPLVTLLEGQFSLVGRQAYSAHSTA